MRSRPHPEGWWGNKEGTGQNACKTTQPDSTKQKLISMFLRIKAMLFREQKTVAKKFLFTYSSV